MAIFTKQIALRLDVEDAERLAELARRIQIVKPAVVLRAALRIGFDALEKDPSSMFSVDNKTARRARSKGGRPVREKKA
jgi:predicted DNA-binding protein